MILESVRSSSGEPIKTDPTRGWPLVVLSIAAALGVQVWFPAAVIGVTAAVMTLLGTLGGRALGARFGSRMAAVGGLVLVAIGVWILFEHLATG